MSAQSNEPAPAKETGSDEVNQIDDITSSEGRAFELIRGVNRLHAKRPEAGRSAMSAWPSPADGFLDIAAIELEAVASSWQPVNLDPVLDGEATDPPPSILERSEGQALLYAGKVHVLAGEPEAGKGWLVCRAVADELNLDHHVLYVDFEDTAVSIVSRLRALAVGALRDRWRSAHPIARRKLRSRHR